MLKISDKILSWNPFDGRANSLGCFDRSGMTIQPFDKIYLYSSKNVYYTVKLFSANECGIMIVAAAPKHPMNIASPADVSPVRPRAEIGKGGTNGVGTQHPQSPDLRSM